MSAKTILMLYVLKKIHEKISPLESLKDIKKQVGLPKKKILVLAEEAFKKGV